MQLFMYALLMANFFYFDKDVEAEQDSEVEEAEEEAEEEDEDADYTASDESKPALTSSKAAKGIVLKQAPKKNGEDAEAYEHRIASYLFVFQQS